MDARSRLRRRLSRGVAIVCLLAAAGTAGVVISSGCGEITSTPVEPGVVDKGVISLKIEPAATSVAPGKALDIAVAVTDGNGRPVADGTLVSLLNDTLGVITPSTVFTSNGVAHATFQAGAASGTSTIKASTGGVTQSINVRIDAAAAPPPPPPPSGPTGDAIPISSITFFDPSPANFKVTATLSNVSVDAPGGTSGPVTVCWDWTHPPWPGFDAKGVTGNMWIIANIDGRWCAGTWEMMAPKLDYHACRTTEAKSGQPPFIQSDGPTSQWYPRSGEMIGHMISTVTRGGIPDGSPNERTPIVVTYWP